jgi:hypothetical protein
VLWLVVVVVLRGGKPYGNSIDWILLCWACCAMLDPFVKYLAWRITHENDLLVDGQIDRHMSRFLTHEWDSTTDGDLHFPSFCVFSKTNKKYQ